MLFVSVAAESVGVAAATLVGPPLIGNGADRPPGTGQAGGILWGNGRFRPITGVEF